MTMETMYEEEVKEEVVRWKRKMGKRSSMAARYAKQLQAKVNQLIPAKVHTVVTNAIKHMVHATLIGSEYMTKSMPKQGLSLEEREEIVKRLAQTYKRTAAIEGAGTGAGGVFLGIADFPLLLSIKMKFLFEVATAYGYDVRDYRERLFLLYLFQLAYARDEKRPLLLERIERWEEEKHNLPSEETYLSEIDWQQFQLDYRDYIDLPKMLQLIPGFGAIVGVIANARFLDLLKETAMNSYRLRYFSKTE